MIELDRRYRSSWDARSIAHVVGISPSTVATILREERGPRPKRARPSHERRTRFLRRDVMWSSDFVELPDGRKLCRTMDEMSRFRPGWDPAASESAESAASHAEGVIKRMGRTPLVWKYDHGSAFTSDKFQDVLARYGIVPYPIAPRAPWANGRTERDNRELRNWLIPVESKQLKPEELDRDVDDGMMMLNYVKPRAVLKFNTSAKTYFEAPGIEKLDRERFIAELVALKNQFGESRSSERVHRKAVRVVLQRWGLYEEWSEAESVNRLEAAHVAF